MKHKLTRRDFLKLLSTIPPVLTLPPSVFQSNHDQRTSPNIVVLVFDAWSAHNISLYGYPRKTTPNLENLAKNAIVYHNHYAGGHFTIPGTASLLTGALPWRHQVYHRPYPLAEDYQNINLFGLFPEYTRFAYTHNLLAEDVIRKMLSSLDTLKPWQDLYYWSNPAQKMFFQDSDVSSVSWIRSMDTLENGYANSLLLSRFWSYLTKRSNEQFADIYPLGLPNFSNSYSFILEDAIDWLAKRTATLSSPSITYFHLLPPHDPYNTRVDFYQAFAGDGYSPRQKAEHYMADGINDKENAALQEAYDEYILYVDHEINRLFQLLNSERGMENTWVIVTSDHGEIFERGLQAHKKPSFFEPLARVPLIIFPPGKLDRVDVHAPTSATDILPTLLHVAGKSIPAAVEGEILPPFNQSYDANRVIFQIDSQFSGFELPDPTASIMIRQGKHKLIYHFGNKEYYKILNNEPVVELFNLDQDPEELENIAQKEHEVTDQLLAEINTKLIAENLNIQIEIPQNLKRD